MVGIVRMLPSQPPRDLLGRPELFEPGGDLLGQGSVLELGGLGPAGLLACPAVGAPCAVVLGPAVGANLSRDRRRRAAKPSSDLAHGVASPKPDENLLPLLHAQPSVSRLPSERVTLASIGRIEHDGDNGRGAGELPRDLSKRHPSLAKPRRHLPLLTGESWCHLEPPVVVQLIVVQSPSPLR